MQLRRLTHKVMDQRDGELDISPDAQRVLFRGPYLFTSSIESAKLVENHNKATKDMWPYGIETVRTFRDEKKFSRGSILGAAMYRERPQKVVDEINTEGVLVRATRVERVARWTRVIGGTVTAAVVAATAFTISTGDNAEVPGDKEIVPACEDVTDGNEALQPIREARTSVFQDAGLPICEFDEHFYLVLDPIFYE